jgi:hypothetical protein
VAANEAYRAGDLNKARQLVDQAAALDPSRAGLWQQHRDQIAARRLILDARAVGVGGDQQHAHELLNDARQIDPRMPAAWNGDLQGAPRTQPARHVSPRDASASGPRGNAETERPAANESATPTLSRSGSPAQRDRQTPRPSWPSSPAPGEPQRPAATSQVDGTRPLAAAPGEPGARPEATADAPDASTEPAGIDPATRWPAPDPRAARENDMPSQQAQHGQAPDQESPRKQQTHTGRVPAEPRGAENPERSTPPSADWRDEVLNQARQPWQPAPSWPHHPVMHRPPETTAPDAGIEPGY